MRPGFEEVNHKNEYTTTDLAGSAVLVTLGYSLVRITWPDQKKALFIFHRGAGIEKVMSDYWSNLLMVDPRKFWENLKMIKSRLYES